MGLDPLGVEAMAEIGIDISHQTSKDVTQLAGKHIHYLVTVCDKARTGCPVFAGTYRFLCWNFDDPAAVTGSHNEKLAIFRRVRDEIAARIDQELLSMRRKTIRGGTTGSAA